MTLTPGEVLACGVLLPSSSRDLGRSNVEHKHSNSENLTPTVKLRRLLSSLSPSQRKREWSLLLYVAQPLVFDTSGVAVLVSTGSYCPVHLMHVEIMERAKDHLELCGFSVVAGATQCEGRR